MSDAESGGHASATHPVSEVRSAAKGVEKALDDGRASGQSADIVRGMVRQTPLLALASAFLMGLLVGRRR